MVDKITYDTTSLNPKMPPPMEKQPNPPLSGVKPKLYVRVEPMVNGNTTENPEIKNIAYINDDMNPILINNEHFTGHIVFRVKDFKNGFTPIDPDTGKPKPIISNSEGYFGGHRRSFSMQINGRFKEQWTGDDVMFGTFFYRPIPLPSLSRVALALAQQIDPSMAYQLKGDNPYICSPIICAMNTVNVQPLFAKNHNYFTTTTSRSSIFEDAEQPTTSDFLSLKKKDKERRSSSKKKKLNTNISSNDQLSIDSMVSATSISSNLSPSPNNRQTLHDIAVEEFPLDKEIELNLPEWKWGGDHCAMEENLLGEWSNLINRHSNTILDDDDDFRSVQNDLSSAVRKNKTDASARRNWFLDKTRRERFIYNTHTVYGFDFANQYVDMNEIILKLGLSVNAGKHLDGIPVRYECRNREGIIFFSIEFGLA